METCAWPEGCGQEPSDGGPYCYYHSKLATNLIWPSDVDLMLWDRRDREREGRVRKAMATVVDEVPNDPPTAYVVVVPVSEECYTAGHSLNRYSDGITCADCETVAAQAALDGVDVDTAIQLFRSGNWA